MKPATQDRISHFCRPWVVCFLVVCCVSLRIGKSEDGVTESDRMHNWPQWRGPLGTGVAPEGKPPVEWSETKNVRWKRELPGGGHSTPIVWGDKVFITAAVPFGDAVVPKPDTAPGAHDNLPVRFHHKFVVIAVSRQNGKILWERTLSKQLPHEGGHNTGSLASNSPVTDGKHVFAFFGSRGLYCLDFDGNLSWKKDLGTMQTLHAHGEGSSPALHGNTLVINWDHEGGSFLMALDKRTGKQIWKVARKEVTSWATPLIIKHHGRLQVIVSGTSRVRGYELTSGKVIWECGGLSRNVVASPVAANGIVFAASSYDTRAMLAIRLDGAKGDITGSDQVVWIRTRGTPYVPSLLLYDDSLYFLRHYQNVLSKVNTKTAKDQGGPFRLTGITNIFASPVGAGNHVYVTDRNGGTMVLSHGKDPSLVSFNRLDDGFSASLAIVGDEIFLRGQRSLYCIAEDED